MTAPRPEPAPPTLLSCGKRDAGSICSSRRTRCCVGRRRICRSPICRERLYPLVNELAIDGIPVAVMCRVLKLARQP